MNPAITGLGVYLPKHRMSAADIAAASGLPEAIVINKLGMTQKTLAGPDDHTNVMGVRAAQAALVDARMAAEKLDVVISINEEHKEFPVWTSGIKLAHDLGAHNAYAFDIGQKCGTGVLGLKLAQDMINSDRKINTVLVAGGYRNGDLVDMRDSNTRFLYNLAAGGGAAVVQRGGHGHTLLGSRFITDGSFSEDVLVPVGGTRAPLTADNLGEFRLQVRDPTGMKARLEEKSLDNFCRVVEDAVTDSGATLADVAYIAMLHMKRSAHEQILARLGLNSKQSIYLSDYGHIGQVDQFLSLTLARDAGKLKAGDLLVLVAAGIGYVWNAICLRWGGDA